MSKSFISAKLPAASWWRYDYNWYWHVDVFRPAHFIKHMKFGQIEHSMFELA